MRGLKEQVLEELEFTKVRELVFERCQSQSGKAIALKIAPLYNKKLLVDELQRVNEYLKLILFDQQPPAFSGDEIFDDLKLLKIENSIVREDGFMRILDLCTNYTALKKFIDTRETPYPFLETFLSDLEVPSALPTAIHKVLDPKGEVKSSASKALKEIRASLNAKTKSLRSLFDVALNRYNKAGYLAETKESFMHDRRVLSVLSENKKRVPGHVLGISSTGKISYIEPSETIEISNEILVLEHEERLEINKILRELSSYFRPHHDLLFSVQKQVVKLDVIRAKAVLAEEMKAVLPEIQKQQEIYLIGARHPLLYLKNKVLKQETKAHTIQLSVAQRFLVISGPNAGGKSISLKTVGLIQLMFQSGLLVPVKEYSRLSFFDAILSDIGDNQSIENELSTYSYRLQQMKYFLETATPKSLILIDEFGTGSDPDLGGAIAEVFFRELYAKLSFGVITTHYMNIKNLASELPEAENACMLFDKQTLSPLYELEIGQPGSSFTFEVAQKMGISLNLIQQARKLVKRDKLKFDEGIAALQKEKAVFEELKNTYKAKLKQTQEQTKENTLKEAYFDTKFEQMQDLQQRSEKETALGKKMHQWLELAKGSESDFNLSIKKFKNYLTVELAKQQEVEKKKESTKPKQTVSWKTNYNKYKAENIAKAEAKPLSVGAKVKILGSSETGIVKELGKKKAQVQFGAMLSQVKVEHLEVV